jgi:uncharacterized membrane protein YqhA
MHKEDVMWQVIIHGMFLVSALAMAWTSQISANVIAAEHAHGARSGHGH